MDQFWTPERLEATQHIEQQLQAIDTDKIESEFESSDDEGFIMAGDAEMDHDEVELTMTLSATHARAIMNAWILYQDHECLSAIEVMDDFMDFINELFAEIL